MAEIDDELIARTLRWCAEAGRQSTAAEARAALAPLTWDELLAVRALLADPPPARPLGPHALADVARGTAADVAAERQREGRYREEPEAAPSEPVTAEAPAPAPEHGAERRPRGRRKRAATPIVIRRASERAEAPPAPTRELPLVDELLRPEGRSELERLVRRHGGRRAAIVAELAAGWRHGDGTPASADDLARLLEEHGLSRVYERRERDEALHALRAAGGMMIRAAAALGVTAEELPALLARTGAERDAERIRAERREELRRRATLAERARLLTEERERLADLEILAELEDDFRARLPEHLRALRASGEEHLAAGLARTLALPRPAAESLARRLQIPIAEDRPHGVAPARAPRPAEGTVGGMRPPRRPAHDAGRARPPAGGRTTPPQSTPLMRPAGPSHAGRPAGGVRPRPGPSGPSRFSRPATGRPRATASPGSEPAARPSPTRYGAPRPGASARPGPTSRPGAPRSGPRPGSSGAPHTGGPRPGSSGAPRTGGPRPGSFGAPRTGGPRPGSFGAPRTGGPRPGSFGAPRTGGPRPGSFGAPRSPRAGSRPGGSGRPGAPRSGPPRSGPPRTGAPRTGAPRGGPTRPRGPRPPRGDR